MLRGIVTQSLNFRFLIIVIAVVVMLFGMVRLRDMPLGVLPEFSPPYVEVQTEALGLSAEEVEQLITIPMEQDLLNGVAWLEEIRSESVPGLSSIVLFFEPGTDVYRARQMVAERLTQAAVGIPQVSKPPTMLQPLSSTSRFIIVGLSSEQLSLIELSVLARWTIGPQLMGVPGVANVGIWGQRERQLQVQVDLDRLRAQGVTLQQILETTGNALWVSSLTFTEGSTPGTGGFIDTANQRLGIWHVLPISSPEELAQVPVEDTAGLRLSDVAEVVEDHPLLIGDAVLEAGPSLLLVVEKLPGVNTLEVTRGVENALDALSPGLPGVEMDTTVYRPASFIETAIDNLTRTLLLAAIVLVVVLLAFFWDIRSALISLAVIPVSLMAALFVLDLRGSTLNSMVLAGLVAALAAIIDDAIVDVENVVRRVRQHRAEGTDKSIFSIVLEASLEVRNAIVYASLIEISALLPIFLMEGLSGAFFRPLATAYVVAGLVSPLVALTVTPALVYIFLSRAPLQHRQSPFIPWLHHTYDRALTWTLHRARLVYGAVAVVVVGGLLVVPFLGQELLPEFKERDFLMHWLLEPGASHPEAVRITTQASKELRQIPGVRNFGAHIGQALLADEVVGIYFTENWISIEPSVPYEETVAAIQATVDGYPGLVRDVQTYLKERIREVLTGSSDAIVIRVYGPELHELQSLTEEVRQALSRIEGIVDLKVELHADVPQVEVEVDLAAAQYYGIKPGDVRRAAGTLLAGLEVGDVFKDGKTYDVNIWSTPDTRHSLTSIREMLIDTPGGGRVRLEDVADIRIVPSPNVVEREGQSRKQDVSANVRGCDLGSVADEVEDALEAIDFPLGYHAELLGEYAERQAATQRIFIAAAVAGGVIFFLLLQSVTRLRLALMAALTLVTTLMGGLLTAYFLGNGILSLGSTVGFFTILGISVRNKILMINHYQHLEEEEGVPFGFELVLRGSRERLAPILMTALATGLALVPLVIAGNIPGHEIEHPMAMVILGGLTTSALTNLFVVPTLYLRLGKTPARN